ncbi:MAG: hypothetical protein SCK29_00395 [Bacillota bacterium]|nr:hypothetical protein [Bacillota bacterium]MDW7682560.1 hypothetical protein [Bacillota bacterium]
MAEKLMLFHFDEMKPAREAKTKLREKGITVHLERDENGMPDPDFSVSALMVGFLPDLSHGIFGTDNEKDDGSEVNGAHILAVIKNGDDEQNVKNIVSEFGGKHLETRTNKE